MSGTGRGSGSQQIEEHVLNGDDSGDELALEMEL
jgi:hypothetical protein